MSRSLTAALVALLTIPVPAIRARAEEPASLRAAQLDASKPLPSGVKAEGAKVEQVWSWTESDQRTSGLAVFSSTEKRSGGRLSDRRIYVQLFRSEAGTLKQLRLVRDGVGGCEYDLTAEFLPGSVTVTDVDSDGAPELTFAYDLACRSDVSPATRKLLVLEGKDKHALRGTERIDPGNGEVLGGEYKADGFAGQKALKEFAVARWNQLLKTSSLLP
jgi:hypothetical protein